MNERLINDYKHRLTNEQWWLLSDWCCNFGLWMYFLRKGAEGGR